MFKLTRALTLMLMAIVITGCSSQAGFVTTQDPDTPVTSLQQLTILASGDFPLAHRPAIEKQLCWYIQGQISRCEGYSDAIEPPTRYRELSSKALEAHARKRVKGPLLIVSWVKNRSEVREYNDGVRWGFGIGTGRYFGLGTTVGNDGPPLRDHDYELTLWQPNEQHPSWLANARARSRSAADDIDGSAIGQLGRGIEQTLTEQGWLAPAKSGQASVEASTE
ncbi:hypothetical protein BFW38_08640 [Terasakiispira papahanaumokuakeensis]|uniref:DUF4136 domain-containing protein n=1 Tax=Terasakiispira papahanaumokuakeensis TaxID=197479 RepID=A0A1E2V9D2_9GAMM|nr:hypothetical protein [Terasakiispira papahanaumokuakeensis]ODC03601.1 hypothetical protein BFW38_08640 [Terasakiispira papahanaumokuakeensis]